jgi:hypothetical protein
MKPLFDDPGLPSELRAELLRSRSAGRDYDVLAKLPKLREALNGSQATADRSRLEHEPATFPSRFGRAQLSLGGAAWKFALLVAVGAAVYVGWPAQPALQRPTNPAPAAQPAEPAATTPPTVAEPESNAIVATPPASEVVAPQPAASPRAAARFPRQEIAQLVRIRALLEQDPAAAYRLAERSEQEFPRGVLSEERRALQVLALAKSGAIEAARRKAQDFFARYPQSPMRELVEAELRRSSATPAKK